jgi:hypothetical protein
MRKEARGKRAPPTPMFRPRVATSVGSSLSAALQSLLDGRSHLANFIFHPTVLVAGGTKRTVAVSF